MILAIDLAVIEIARGPAPIAPCPSSLPPSLLFPRHCPSLSCGVRAVASRISARPDPATRLEAREAPETALLFTVRRTFRKISPFRESELLGRRAMRCSIAASGSHPPFPPPRHTRASRWLHVISAVICLCGTGGVSLSRPHGSPSLFFRILLVSRSHKTHMHIHIDS